jgi:undecaprenyl-diphosphatase
VCVPLYVLLTALLWLGDRPGGPVRWRLACLSGVSAAGVALLTNMALGAIWFRDRPFTTHPGDVTLVAGSSADPSFPSDHASAAFAIAFAVFFVSRRAGAVFLGLALAIGLSRIALGLHYPSDIAAGAVVGFVAAATVHAFARRPLVRVALLLSRLTDRPVAFVWAALSRLQAGSGGSLPPGGSSS